MADNPKLIEEIVHQVFIQNRIPSLSTMNLAAAREVAKEVIESRKRKLCHDVRYKLHEWGLANESLQIYPEWIHTNTPLYEYTKRKTCLHGSGVKQLIDKIKALGTSADQFHEIVYAPLDQDLEFPFFTLEEYSEPPPSENNHHSDNGTPSLPDGSMGIPSNRERRVVEVDIGGIEVVEELSEESRKGKAPMSYSEKKKFEEISKPSLPPKRKRCRRRKAFKSRK